MDNKKWYKRISTCFWFFLAILPFIVALIQFIGYHLTFNSGISSATDLADYHTIVSGSFSNILISNVSFFQHLTPTFILSTFGSLFTYFGFNDSYRATLLIFSSWFCWTYMLELLIDFVVWFPKLIHSFMERWCAD